MRRLGWVSTRSRALARRTRTQCRGWDHDGTSFRCRSARARAGADALVTPRCAGDRARGWPHRHATPDLVDRHRQCRRGGDLCAQLDRLPSRAHRRAADPRGPGRRSLRSGGATRGAESRPCSLLHPRPGHNPGLRSSAVHRAGAGPADGPALSCALRAVDCTVGGGNRLVPALTGDGCASPASATVGGGDGSLRILSPPSRALAGTEHTVRAARSVRRVRGAEARPRDSGGRRAGAPGAEATPLADGCVAASLDYS